MELVLPESGLVSGDLWRRLHRIHLVPIEQEVVTILIKKPKNYCTIPMNKNQNSETQHRSKPGAVSSSSETLIGGDGRAESPSLSQRCLQSERPVTSRDWSRPETWPQKDAK